jgi:hypothetical protein
MLFMAIHSRVIPSWPARDPVAYAISGVDAVIAPSGHDQVSGTEGTDDVRSATTAQQVPYTAPRPHHDVGTLPAIELVVGAAGDQRIGSVVPPDECPRMSWPSTIGPDASVDNVAALPCIEVDEEQSTEREIQVVVAI